MRAIAVRHAFACKPAHAYVSMAPELLCTVIALTGWPMPSIPFELIRLHDAYRSGALKPSAVVEARLARVAACGADASAPVWISTVDADALRQRAASLDRMLADGRDAALSSPVFGALYAVKDNIDVAGLPTTAGCPAFAYTPQRSAHVVEQLEAAGAIVIGKTNLDQFATGLVGKVHRFVEIVRHQHHRRAGCMKTS